MVFGIAVAHSLFAGVVNRVVKSIPKSGQVVLGEPVVAFTLVEVSTLLLGVDRPVLARMEKELVVELVFENSTISEAPAGNVNCWKTSIEKKVLRFGPVTT